MDCFFESLGLSFGISGASWAAFGALLGLSWTHLGPFWSLLGPVLVHPVPLLAYLRHLWPTCALGGLLWVTGALFQAPLGLSWTLFWVLFGLSWSHFGFHVVFFCLPEGSLRASGAILGIASVEQGLLIPRTSFLVVLCTLQSGLAACRLQPIFANSRALKAI